MSRPAASTAGGEGTHIPVQPKALARARFLSALVQDLPAVLTALAAGASAIRSGRAGGGGGLALAAAELLLGAWVLVAVAREARHLFSRAAAHHAPASPHEPRVDRAGVVAAALGYVEVWRHAVERGHFKLVSPFMLAATVTLALALGGRRLIAHRMRHPRPHLLVTPTSVTYRGRRRRRWTAAWDDVAAVEHAPGALTVRLRDGRAHVLRADDHLGGDGLLAAARAAVAAHAPPRLAAGAGAPAVR